MRCPSTSTRAPGRGAAAFATFAFAFALAAGCRDEFTSYGRLEGRLRVLAVQAEPPWLAPGETSTVTALVHTPDGEAASLEWSWCPFPGDPSTGYACTSPGGARALGNGERVPFIYPGTAASVRALCEQLTAAGSTASPFVVLPDCERGPTVTVSLRARWRDQEVVAVKDLRLTYGGSENRNPSLGGVAAAVEPPGGRADPGSARSLDGGGALRLGSLQRLWVEVPSEAAEEVGGGVREELLLTWFVSAGETAFTRTAWAEPDLSLDQARTNTWKLPADPADAAAGAKLVVVIRDDRGGVGWLLRGLSLQP